MTPRRPRALEIEAYAISTMTGAIDAQRPLLSSGCKFVQSPRTSSRGQAMTQWIAIALLLAGAGLELILCFTVESSGIL